MKTINFLTVYNVYNKFLLQTSNNEENRHFYYTLFYTRKRNSTKRFNRCFSAETLFRQSCHDDVRRKNFSISMTKSSKSREILIRGVIEVCVKRSDARCLAIHFYSATLTQPSRWIGYQIIILIRKSFMFNSIFFLIHPLSFIILILVQILLEQQFAISKNAN